MNIHIYKKDIWAIPQSLSSVNTIYSTVPNLCFIICQTKKNSLVSVSGHRVDKLKHQVILISQRSFSSAHHFPECIWAVHRFHFITEPVCCYCYMHKSEVWYITLQLFSWHIYPKATLEFFDDWLDEAGANPRWGNAGLRDLLKGPTLGLEPQTFQIPVKPLSLLHIQKKHFNPNWNIEISWD